MGVVQGSLVHAFKNYYIFFFCRHKLSRDLKLYQQLLILPIIAIEV